MKDPFRSVEDYELFLYSLTAQFPRVDKSTVILVRRGASLARVSGELHFEAGYRVVIRERLSFAKLPLVIDG